VGARLAAAAADGRPWRGDPCGEWEGGRARGLGGRAARKIGAVWHQKALYRDTHRAVFASRLVEIIEHFPGVFFLLLRVCQT